MTDSGFKSIHAGIEAYTPVSVVSHNYVDVIVVLHDTTCTTNCGVIFINFDMKVNSCTSTTVIRLIRHSSGTARWIVKDFKSSNAKDYVTLLDTND